ncbi:4-phosphoerythronate dehydrogenase [Kangiella koreensis]|uniref:Erythronate-4-phosphate dehydrogenase n=1 Tax=Kangiella koreensis (strain DSM 16069 / JCM 12317 / KCTC 12182 / SW-125) TaxID=523791 RepID=C7RAU4_KANKD|nr:4-phosphoerythronate dehydrogenase [Kangiella koreensis]ACV26386.1 D-isomer specific 2-hydroxyacid dehydrogenase catalytic region [Kangiella koreensis DSM 16069]
MKIIADENMPLVKELFEPFAEVELLAGRNITTAHLTDADALLVRSVTQVNSSLLQGSNIKFVGSATIGTDHIDHQYLDHNGIQFAYAPGCNAQAVAEYVLSGVAYWAQHRQKDLAECRVGIIGAGNVGSKVAQVLELLGINYLLNDPPLESQGDSRSFVPLAAIQQCDIVTCHVPLAKDGQYPTYHLINEEFLSGMLKGSLLINSSRGAVLDNEVALQASKSEQSIDFILDVWENEPELNLELLNETLIATPHIAGYSQEGKIRGTYQLYQAFCQWQGIEPKVTLKELLPQAPKWNVPAQIDSQSGMLYQSLQPFYDIKQDDSHMRQVMSTVIREGGATITEEFDSLRKNYPQRLEFLELG